MKSNAPYTHQTKNDLPLLLAIAAGMHPMIAQMISISTSLLPSANSHPEVATEINLKHCYLSI